MTKLRASPAWAKINAPSAWPVWEQAPVVAFISMRRLCD